MNMASEGTPLLQKDPQLREIFTQDTTNGFSIITPPATDNPTREGNEFDPSSAKKTYNMASHKLSKMV